MSSFEVGSFVCHAKLPELGSGQVLLSERGTVKIRFAAGERSFSLEKAAEHLTVTQEAPRFTTTAGKGGAKKAKAKAKAKPPAAT